MDIKDRIKFAFIIVLVVALGCLALNQLIGFVYKTQLMQEPCLLCKEANPHYKPCFEEQSTYYINTLTGEKINNKIKINLTGFNP